MADPLFEPISIGTLKLPNRLVMAPMSQGKAPGGILHPAHAGFYRRRAEGGIGLIISGATSISHDRAAFDDNEAHFHGSALEGWVRVVDDVHAGGGRIIPQLGHAGLQGLAVRPPATPSFGPSGVWLPGAQVGIKAGPERAGPVMTLTDVDAVIEAFAAATEAAQRAGFDGAEIHAAHGFLIDQFLWSRTNRRTDHYGMDRARFAAEIVAACREAVGPDFPIFMRISQFKMTDYDARLAETPGELARLIEPIAAAGVDCFDCSQRRYFRPEFPGSPLNFAGWVKKLTGKRTIGGGGIGLTETSLEYGETNIYATIAPTAIDHLDDVREKLARGEFDMVSLGRAILGDPAWAHKVREGRHAELTPFKPELMMSLDG